MLLRLLKSSGEGNTILDSLHEPAFEVLLGQGLVEIELHPRYSQEMWTNIVSDAVYVQLLYYVVTQSSIPRTVFTPISRPNQAIIKPIQFRRQSSDRVPELHGGASVAALQSQSALVRALVPKPNA